MGKKQDCMCVLNSHGMNEMDQLRFRVSFTLLSGMRQLEHIIM